MQEVEQRMEQLPTTAGMQEVEQRMEQLPREGGVEKERFGEASTCRVDVRTAM